MTRTDTSHTVYGPLFQYNSDVTFTDILADSAGYQLVTFDLVYHSC